MTPASYIIVSGGAGGIGSALCRLLPTCGLTPIVGYRNNKEQADALALECGGFSARLDLESDESIAQSLVQISSIVKDGNVAGVVLAASPPPDLLPFGKLSSGILSHQLRVNVVGPQLLLAGLIKTYFRKKKSGVVVGLLSEAIGNDHDSPMTGMGAYVIAKIALRGMLSVCAAEYTWLQIRTVSPGFTSTKMLDVFDERYLEQMQAKKPFSSADDVARLILKEFVSR
jgi:NAD(P)-dependent dehydrogenase (short-subunit alcohol dehydrogenase family)